MTRSGVNFEKRLTEAMPKADTTPVFTPKQQDGRQNLDWFGQWEQDVADSLNRMRTDETYRQEIAAMAT